jgi:biopolymer transport protein ExbB
MAVVELWVAGGAVMPWLLLCTLMLWYALGWRIFALPRRAASRPEAVLRALRQGTAPTGPFAEPVQALLTAAGRRGTVPRTRAAALLQPVHAELRQGRAMVRSLVAIAPLAGLLGTVSGMIETFRSLAEMALFAQGGGIAGGIGEALLTTQMGLAISVPGLVIGRLLDRHEARLHDELDAVADQLCRAPAAAVVPSAAPRRGHAP